MAYRRRQNISRASTFKEEIHHSSDDETPPNPSPALSPSYSFSPLSSSSSSLAAQAIKASAARRDSSLSFAYSDSAFASDHLRSKSFDTYGDLSDRGDSKSGFWGVLAQKAKAILEDDNLSPQNDTPNRIRSHPLIHTSNGGQFKQSYQSPETFRKMDNPTFRKGLDAITSSLNHLGDTFEKAFEEGRTIVENKTADLRTQIKRKGGGPEDPNQASVVRNAWQQPGGPGQAYSPTNHETQLKASRDVAMATAAKAKLLLRELKTVKADLAFAKARCAQLEEENKLLRDREGREKGQNRADDDLIRLQLETLLAEKARLANENEIYSRENRFLREIVEYHQLTMQDVVYLDEGMEEVTEVYPMDTNGMPRVLSVSPHSSSPSSPELLPSGSPPAMTKEIFPVAQDNESASAAEAPPRISLSEVDKRAK